MREGPPHAPPVEASFARVYVLVLLVEAAVIAALSLLQHTFS